MHFHDTHASLPITQILSPHFHMIASANLPNYMMDSVDPSTLLLQVILSLSNDIIKDFYQHIGGKMGELPDLKEWAVAEAIVRKWGERICVMGSDACVS